MCSVCWSIPELHAFLYAMHNVNQCKRCISTDYVNTITKHLSSGFVVFWLFSHKQTFPSCIWYFQMKCSLFKPNWMVKLVISADQVWPWIQCHWSKTFDDSEEYHAENCMCAISSVAIDRSNLLTFYRATFKLNIWVPVCQVRELDYRCIITSTEYWEM